MTMTADVRLHCAIEKTLAQTPRRDRLGHSTKKPKAKEIIAAAFRAEYGVTQCDSPPRAEPVETTDQTQAQPFFTPLMKFFLVLGAACMAMGFLHPILNIWGRLVLECIGVLCLYMSYRCAE